MKTIPILMPQMGQSVAEGTIVRWRKKVGDRVAADEVLMEVESDKITVEVESPSAGRLASCLKGEGARAAIGEVVAMLETDAPYLAPHPFRGQRNEPAHIRLVCEQLASQLGMTTAAIAAATTAVALRFFQLEDLFGADVPERSKSVHA